MPHCSSPQVNCAKLCFLVHSGPSLDGLVYLPLSPEEALADLPESFLQQLEEEPERLKELLTHHVVSPQLDEAGLASARLLPSHLENHQVRGSPDHLTTCWQTFCFFSTSPNHILFPRSA